MTTASSVLSARPESHSPSLPALRFQQPTADSLCVGLDGSWTIQSELPPLAEVQRQFDTQPSVQRLILETQGLTGWDSNLLTFLRALTALCTQRHIEIDQAGLPHGVQRLLRLATAVPERQGAR